MFIWFAFVIVLCLYKIDFRWLSGKEQFFEDYMLRDKTLSIKGIFVLLVFLSHAKGICNGWSGIDNVYLIFNSYMGQLVVAPFLFYSGYGVMHQYLKYGEKYTQSFFRKRILITFIHFDIAVLLYLAIQTLLGNRYPIRHIIGALFGWTDLGNSNWYIFAIIVLYIFTWICLKVFKGRNNRIVLGVLVLTIFYMFAISCFKENWWYDTVLCYAAGMGYKIFEQQIDHFLNSRKTYLSVLLLGILLFGVSYIYSFHMIVWNINAVLFSVLIVLFGKIVSFDNHILRWCGAHIFSLYILQRIPFITYKWAGGGTDNTIAIAICGAATILLAVLFDRMTSYLDKKMILNKK